GIDETPQVVGPAVAAGRGVEADAVVTPAATAGEVGQRHQFDRVDAEVGQLSELRLDTSEGPFRAERADLHLLKDQILPPDVVPAGIGPGKSVRIDNLRGTVDALGLEARGGVRERPAAIDAIAIAIARPDIGEVAVPKATGGALQGMRGAAGRAFQDDLDRARLRRPDAEPGALPFRPGAERWLPAHGILLAALRPERQQSAYSACRDLTSTGPQGGKGTALRAA